MISKTETKINKIFELPNYGVVIFIDGLARLFWKTENSQIKPLATLPWKLQMPFYLTFLHDDNLAERFKDYEILGAIDIYLKSTYFLGESLQLSD